MPKDFLSDAEMAALENQGHAEVPTKSQLESALRGAAQGASMGFADEITGGLESLFTDKPYAQARDESRAQYAQAQEDNPLTYGASEIAGGVGSALATGGAGGVGRLALQGASSGLGYSSADNAADMAIDTATGAAIGGGLGVAGKMMSAPKSGLKSFAENRANAAFNTEGVGRELLDSGAVNPLNSKNAALNKINEAIKPLRAEKDAILKADPTMYDMDDIAAKVQLKLGLPKSDNHAASLMKVTDEVESAARRARGPVNAEYLDEVQDLMGSQGKFNQPTINNPGDKMASQGFRDTYGVMGEELATNNPGLPNLNRKIHGLIEAQEGIGNRGVSIPVSKIGLVREGIKKANEVSAVSADMVAKILPTNPKAFGRYAQVLDNAMRKSPESLKATLHILQMSDPEFRELSQSLTAPDQQFSSDQ